MKRMAEAGKQGDELAQTATAPGSVPKGPTEPIGDSLGRYRLERMLGEGGMGVVHCAFDPDLERRVALKVLRRSDGSDDARQRLLREARAMARLTHPNVVAVHEVGTAGDRDYVAMELIDGHTLADWLRATRRTAREITQAFIAAGRGLAAAHAAGLVHRDFKPHNVLRARDGRVVVTDFGLARGVEAAAISFETTLRPDQAVSTSSTPSSLSGLTATGSVLGTPAYMAPEQWEGGVVGPAADQFAFCVALWEALTGDRPFHGQTLEELRRDVQRGIDAIDLSKVPRRLRAPLRRGLQRDPAKRYPDMDALLAALARADRSSSAFSIAWRAALVLATVGFLMMHERGHAEASCEPPAVELGQVWSPAIASVTPPELAAPFDKLAVRWTMARATACTADPVTRPTQLRCLDGVLARFSAVRQGFARLANGPVEEAMAQLVDPTVCLTPAPPRLGLAATPDSATAFALMATARAATMAGEDAPKPPVAPVQAFVDRPDVEACARTIGLLALEQTALDYPTKRSAVNEAVASSELCEDDRVRASALLFQMQYQFELPVIGPRGQAAVKRAEAAVKRVEQPELTAHIDFVRSMIESQQEHWADAFSRIHGAIDTLDAEGFHKGATRGALEEMELHFTRSRPEDYVAARAIAARWIPVARAMHDDDRVHDFERADAYARYLSGVDVVNARADLVRLWHQKPHLVGDHRRIEGDVVDAAGKPVAGATVAAAREPSRPMRSGVVPLFRLHEGDADLREVTADAAGHFVIDEAPTHGAIVAQLGDRRSNPAHLADRVKLVLEPTRTVSGRVALGGLTTTEASVVALTELGDNYVVIASVKPNATFELAGVPTTKVSVGVEGSGAYRTQLQPTQLPAGTAPISDLQLQVPASGRTLDVLARSMLDSPIETAQIVVMPGRVHVANVGELQKIINNGLDVRFASHVVGESVPRPALDQLKPGDLWARFSNVAMGEVTVCSIGLMNDLMDQDAIRKVQAHIDEIEVHCQTVDGDTKVVVAPTVPLKRFD